jgi:hypothetical protein
MMMERQRATLTQQHSRNQALLNTIGTPTPSVPQNQLQASAAAGGVQSGFTEQGELASAVDGLMSDDMVQPQETNFNVLFVDGELGLEGTGDMQSEGTSDDMFNDALFKFQGTWLAGSIEL